jgi:hypothetical protein
MTNDHNDDLDHLLKRAEADTGEPPPYWDPQPGDTLVGTLRFYTEGTTSVGDRKIAVIEQYPSGELISVWLSRSVLASEFERQQPQPGDGIGLKYVGLKAPRRPGGSEYHLYKLWVSRHTPAPNPPGAPRSSAPTGGSDDDLPW